MITLIKYGGNSVLVSPIKRRSATSTQLSFETETHFYLKRVERRVG